MVAARHDAARRDTTATATAAIRDVRLCAARPRLDVSQRWMASPWHDAARGRNATTSAASTSTAAFRQLHDGAART
jgi:hypothetical protein